MPAILLTEAARENLLMVFEAAKEGGALGPSPVDEHLKHALAWAEILPEPKRFVDLGSGGGVPGLILAMLFPDSEAVLIDARRRRSANLEISVHTLGLTERVSVLCARAEEAGRDPEMRGGFDLVVARSFGSPAITAECAAPFLAVGGSLSVSEPPSASDDRWQLDGLNALGLAKPELHRIGEAGFMVSRLETLCPDRYPRRNGMPEKRPLW
ncbi:MAG: RsmG family class I SAM-dependent methyltransferase [Actinomycetes bacterium]